MANVAPNSTIIADTSWAVVPKFGLVFQHSSMISSETPRLVSHWCSDTSYFALAGSSQASAVFSGLFLPMRGFRYDQGVLCFRAAGNGFRGCVAHWSFG